eukprot:726752-Pelagomonas_calceolata.AAC.3
MTGLRARCAYSWGRMPSASTCDRSSNPGNACAHGFRKSSTGHEEVVTVGNFRARVAIGHMWHSTCCTGVVEAEVAVGVAVQEFLAPVCSGTVSLSGKANSQTLETQVLINAQAPPTSCASSTSLAIETLPMRAAM